MIPPIWIMHIMAPMVSPGKSVWANGADQAAIGRAAGETAAFFSVPSAGGGMTLIIPLIIIAALFILVIALIARIRFMGKEMERVVTERTRELTERTRELEYQTRRAQVASEAKSTFLARMSHEIRTPLNAIIGMTEIARRSIGDEEKTVDSLGRISSASGHLLGILNDVLDMSKIESGKFSLVYEPFSLRHAMDEVLNIIAQRCAEKEIIITSDLADMADYGILGDRLRLKQVLINLLGNAVKFTPDKGRVFFSVQPEAVSEKHIKVCFAVIDTGIGMSRDQMKKLFVAFEQADSSIAVRFGGTGLGLAISQSLVKQMNGEISVDSTTGEGSSFTFTLTFECAEVPEQDDVLSEDTPNFTGRRILLAEDIEINRVIAMELLADTHAKVEEAENGAEAVRKFDESDPGYYNLVLMDVQMPELNGYEATRAIRALPRDDAASVPIVAMTANAYKEDIDQALDAGMNDHLAKPIDIAEMMRTLALWMGE